ncbi:MAG: YnbE family lipoprotein [Alphaproteobacteria bacterium]|nr:YnbE family lipoprotein [Alphaproteobacteria bacterium]
MLNTLNNQRFCSFFFSLILIAGCSPTIRIAPPEKPIEININIKIEEEVRVKLDKDIDSLINKNDELF